MQQISVTTGIAVRRVCDLGSWRKSTIVINGRLAGSVAYGKRVEFALSPGTYAVQVGPSPAHVVCVRKGDLIELEAGQLEVRRPRTFLAALVPMNEWVVRPATGMTAIPLREHLARRFSASLPWAILLVLWLVFCCLCILVGS
jgi:hypothetical protein